jgi:hypothetical protein
MASLSLSRLALAAQAFLVSCASPPPLPPRPPPPVARVPLSVWRLPTRCDAWWAKPATLCDGVRVLDYDGCYWRCRWAPIEGARQ